VWPSSCVRPCRFLAGSGDYATFTSYQPGDGTTADAAHEIPDCRPSRQRATAGPELAEPLGVSFGRAGGLSSEPKRAINPTKTTPNIATSMRDVMVQAIIIASVQARGVATPRCLPPRCGLLFRRQG
jgi:hypothetical protein